MTVSDYLNVEKSVALTNCPVADDEFESKQNCIFISIKLVISIRFRLRRYLIVVSYNL